MVATSRNVGPEEGTTFNAAAFSTGATQEPVQVFNRFSYGVTQSCPAEQIVIAIATVPKESAHKARKPVADPTLLTFTRGTVNGRLRVVPSKLVSAASGGMLPGGNDDAAHGDDQEDCTRSPCRIGLDHCGIRHSRYDVASANQSLCFH